MYLEVLISIHKYNLSSYRVHIYVHVSFCHVDNSLDRVQYLQKAKCQFEFIFHFSCESGGTDVCDFS
jgi:hypothetical protein